MKVLGFWIAGWTTATSCLIEYTFNITQGVIAPDNFAVPGLLINGDFTGPSIFAKEGDELKVTVNNQLDRGFAMHWHGIHQRDTPEMDGVIHLTQKPILPGESFVYKFSLKGHVGTFWYHAHSGLDVENVYGTLIISDEKADSYIKTLNNYSHSEAIIVSEFWHRDVEDMHLGLLEDPIRFTGEINSILFNGRGYRNWGGKSNKTDIGSKGYYNTQIQSGQSFRLHIIAGLGRNVVRFSIEGHKLILVEADGTLIDPIEVDYVDLNGGQRFSVIVKANAIPRDYRVVAQAYSKDLRAGVGIIRVINKQPGKCRPKPLDVFKELPLPDKPLIMNRWVEPKLNTSAWYKHNPIHHYYPVPKTVQKTFYINNTKLYEKKALHFLINGEKMNYDKDSVLLEKVLKGSPLKETKRFMNVQQGEPIQIIIQATVDKNKECDPHPWHLHGYSFYVVGSGEGIYDPVKHLNAIETSLINNDLPILRDTFTMYPPGTPQHPDHTGPSEPAPDNSQLDFDPCGWYAIRLIANNPGSWLLHCHTTAHMIGGMQAVLNVIPNTIKN